MREAWGSVMAAIRLLLPPGRPPLKWRGVIIRVDERVRPCKTAAEYQIERWHMKEVAVQSPTVYIVLCDYLSTPAVGGGKWGNYWIFDTREAAQSTFDSLATKHTVTDLRIYQGRRLLQQHVYSAKAGGL